MSLPSQRPFVGLGRFGKVSGLMICLKRRRCRSSSQAPGGLGAVGSGPLRRRRACGGQRGTLQLPWILCLKVIAPSDIKKFLIKRALLLGWKEK